VLPPNPNLGHTFKRSYGSLMRHRNGSGEEVTVVSHPQQRDDYR
jgi:hypothetical protein